MANGARALDINYIDGVHVSQNNEKARIIQEIIKNTGAPDKPCGVGCADVNPKLLLNDT